MTVGQFSYFTLVWWNKTRSNKIKYVDESGKELPVKQSAFNNAEDRTETKYLIYDIDGYEYSYAYINTDSEDEDTRILPVLYRSENGGWMCYYTYYMDKDYLRNGDTVYVVYKKKTSPTQGGTPSTTTFGNKPSNPTVKKESTDNGNGTREIALSIKGSEADSTEKAKADVIVILDTSGSMIRDLESNEGSSSKRLNAAKSALNTLADTLLTNNNNGAVRLSLITFSDTAAQPYGFTSSNSAFKGYYRNLSANGGTNWEDALAKANRMSVRSDAATYVIFVTDGDPTFRNSRGNYTDKTIEDYNEDRAYDDNLKNNTRDIIFGDGNNDRNNANHNAALAEAKSIVANNKNFYTIGIGPSVGDLQQFTSSLGLAASGTNSHYFSALDNGALTEAFEKIADTIVTKLGFANVRMTDGITSLTNLSAKVGSDSTSGFTYTMTDSNGNDMTVPDNLKTAKYDADSGSVVWNFPAGYQLEDGVTYKVSFTVWPSQAALDHVAKLNSGKETYDSLPDDIKAQIVNTNGTYSLKTNDKTQNVKVQNSTSVGGSAAVSGDDIVLPFNAVENLSLADANVEVTVHKDWSGVTPSAASSLYTNGVKLTVSDSTTGGVTDELTLKGPEWSGTAHISAGFALLNANGTLNVLEEGHNFAITEETSMANAWTLSAGTYHPMLIDGKLTMLQKGDVEGATTKYTIGDDTYSVVSQAGGKFILNATNTAKGTSIIVKKKWGDNENQDGRRPGSVTVHLYADDKDTGKTVTLSAGDNWAEKSFTDLSRYDSNGKEIAYTVKEDDVDGYTAAVTGSADDGFTITNTHIPSKISVRVRKMWDDADNQDGIRPDNSDIWITLFADGVGKTSAKLNDSGEVTFNNLDEYKSGTKINYTVSETNVPTGYTYRITGNAKDGFTITNIHTPKTINVTVNKTWDDANNRDGKQPDSVKVQLYKGDEAQGEKVDLNSSNNWSYTWTALDQKSAGKDIDYTVQEVNTPDEYKATVTKSNNGDNVIVNISNKHDPETLTISGTKTWDDDGDRDDKRPSEINVTLTGKVGDNVVYTNTQTVRADASGDWKYSFTGLYKYNAGKEIQYTISEDAVDGYTTTVNGYNITNKHDPEQVTISGTKTWDDGDNRDDKRPKEVTIKLFANSEEVTSQTISADASGNWNYSFTVPKYENGGHEITYSVAEVKDKDGNYSSEVDGNNITNSYTPDKTSVEVIKNWDDADDQDGVRPGSVDIYLLANGTRTGDTVTLDAGNNWSASFTDLPKNEDGKAIVYTVEEDQVKNYDKPVITQNEQTGAFIITNTHTPETTSVSGTKTWDDKDNQDGIRPSSINVILTGRADDGSILSEQVQTVTPDTKTGEWAYSWDNLPKNNAGKSITYTVTEEAVGGYTTTVDGYDVTNTHTPKTINVTVNKTWDDGNNRDGKQPDSVKVQLYKGTEKQGEEIELNSSNNWTHTWIGLAQKSVGKDIDYTVQEVSTPDGYKATVTKSNSGDDVVVDITNKHDPETLTISGTKTWDDDDNRDGKRPTEINVTLTGKVGDTVVATDKQIVRADASDNWKYTFSNLYKYDGGKEIQYTVSEDAVDGYTTTIDGYNITNKHDPEQVTISGTKTWNDGDNRDDKRPKEVTIKLFANSEEVTSQTISADASGNWNYSFTVPKYENGGHEITYSVAEVKDKDGNYSSEVNGYKITNSYTPEETSVEVIKNWDDADNQDGVRPGSVVVSLLANDKDTGKTVTLDAGNNWSASFTDLPKNEDGKAIVYTVEEDQVKDYDAPAITQDPQTGAFIITNRHTPETTSISGKKTWDDASDQDGIRPDSIKVILTGTDEDGSVLSEKVQTVTPDTNENWIYTFDNLPKNNAGKTITYTVSEEAVAGYTTTVNGNNITNTHTPETTSISGTKTWNDGNDQDGIRPSTITVILTGTVDGNQVSRYTKTVTSDTSGNWTYTFENLPKNNAGKAITYTVSEEAVKDYTTTVTGHNITNTHTPETTSISGTKTWDDDGDRDGIRPKTITITLTGAVDGNEVYTQTQDFTANAEGDWKYIFEGVPKKSAGKEITYTVSEKAVKGYTTKINGFDITNTHEPETTSVAGTKTWEDNDIRTGNRPTGITVFLHANGQEQAIASKPVSAGDGWTYSFTNLPKYENGGHLINYTVTESSTKNYSSEVKGTNITNTYTPDQTSVTVVKNWDDNGDQDGKRPDTVNVYLLANGRNTGKTLVLDEESNWEGTFPNLDVDQDGKPVTYTVQEFQVDGYEEPVYSGDTAKGFVITNKRTPEKIAKISGTKTWNDNEDQDSRRPDHIYVTLTGKIGDTEVYKSTQRVTPSGGEWNYSWDNLDRYKDGREIVYSVSEVPVDGYTAEVTGYNITNTHTPEKIEEISGTKTWNDDGDRDGRRPTEITVYITGKVGDETVYTGSQKVIPDQNGDWKYSFSGLDKYYKGQEIQYTVSEDSVSGYTTTVDGYDITNTHTPETIAEISGTKIWNDSGNQDGKRPPNVTIELFGNGEKVKTQTVTAADNWKYSFTNLPKYENGKVIDYVVAEAAVENYTTTVHGYSITNSYTPGKTSVEVIKRWDDGDNQDGRRPGSVEVFLLADGQATGKTVTLDAGNKWSAEFTDLDEMADGKVITYSVSETPVDGYGTPVVTKDASGIFIITNTRTPETIADISGTKTWDDADNQDGIRPDSIKVILTGTVNGNTVFERDQIVTSDNWKYSFTNLPKYNSGTEIIYAVREEAVDGYTAKVDGYNITNTHKPETIADISGTKIWNDGNNQDGKRPPDVTIELFANGEKKDTKTISEADNWTYSFTNLPKYENGGKEIIYSIAETQVDDYSSAVSGYDITNSYTPGETSVEVIKRWDDSDNQDGLRPDSVEVSLLADGADTGRKVTLSAANSWSAEFTELLEYSNGTRIRYTVSEEQVRDYETPVVTGEDGIFIITNKHIPGTISVSGTKTWDDADNQDGKRPDSITVRLFADGEEKQSVEVTAKEGWKYSFTDLPKNNGGKAVAYTVAEDSVENYAAETDGYDITNSYTPGETSVTVIKNWDDGDDQDGLRPDGITVRLYADGEYTGNTVTLSAANNWQDTFTELPEYRNGTKIEYTVSEAQVSGYDEPAVTEGAEGIFIITNKHTPETTDISGTKTWDDDDDRDGKRPDSITVRLLADGEEVQSAEVTAEEDWKYSFTGLPKNKNGKTITYTVSEDAVEGYTTRINGYDITNVYTPEMISVAGRKIWNDNNDQDGKRLAAITVHLRLNGEIIDTRTVSTAEDWTYSFTNLPKYENGGHLINYTVTENTTEDYSSTVNGYDITNSYTPGKTSVTVLKDWDDDDDRDGQRPDSVTVHLYADGEDTGKTVTLDESNKWEAEFTDLDEYQNGQKIAYTVSEDQVEGYEEPVITGDAEEGYVITNSRIYGIVSVSGTKTWDDANNQDGKRPDSITVRLLADGDEVQSTKVTAKDNWKYSFTDLPEYRDGSEIVYTVTEDTVEGYTSAVDGYNITNSYTPGETSVTVTKKWDDGNDRDGIRPDSITVRLLADGADTGKSVALSAANNWSAQFTDLAVNKDGRAIVYTVSEDQVSGYETPVITGDAQKGFVITNTHTPKEEPDKPNGKDKPSEPSGNKPSGTGSNGNKTTGSSSGSSGTQSGRSAKTGDAANIAQYLILLIAAATVLAGMAVRRRKKK